MSAQQGSPFVHFRPAPAAVRQFVHEAVVALGYFHEEAADELADIFEQLWPTGTSSTMLI